LGQKVFAFWPFLFGQPIGTEVPMLSSLTDIANYALHTINAGTIASIDTSTDKASSTCKRYIDLAFDRVISQGEFTSCRRRMDLSASSETPFPGYSYAYNLPSRYPSSEGYVKALELESHLPYEIEGWVLSTSDPAPRLLYLYRPANLARYQPMILDAVAYRLAELIITEIAPDANRKIQIEYEAQSLVRQSRAHSLQEQKGKRTRNNTWNSFNEGTERYI